MTHCREPLMQLQERIETLTRRIERLENFVRFVIRTSGDSRLTHDATMALAGDPRMRD
jgi:hypothetical protein